MGKLELGRESDLGTPSAACGVGLQDISLVTSSFVWLDVVWVVVVVRGSSRVVVVLVVLTAWLKGKTDC